MSETEIKFVIYLYDRKNSKNNKVVGNGWVRVWVLMNAFETLQLVISHLLLTVSFCNNQVAKDDIQEV